VSPDYLAWGGDALALDALAEGIKRAQCLLDELLVHAHLSRAGNTAPPARKPAGPPRAL